MFLYWGSCTHRMVHVQCCQLVEAVGALPATQHAVVCEAEVECNLIQPAVSTKRQATQCLCITVGYYLVVASMLHMCTLCQHTLCAMTGRTAARLAVPAACATHATSRSHATPTSRFDQQAQTQLFTDIFKPQGRHALQHGASWTHQAGPPACSDEQ
jgi:hypothetical protein